MYEYFQICVNFTHATIGWEFKAPSNILVGWPRGLDASLAFSMVCWFENPIVPPQPRSLFAPYPSTLIEGDSHEGFSINIADFTKVILDKISEPMFLKVFAPYVANSLLHMVQLAMEEANETLKDRLAAQDKVIALYIRGTIALVYMRESSDFPTAYLIFWCFFYHWNSSTKAIR